DLDGLRVARPVWQFWEDFGRLVGIGLDARRWGSSLSWFDAQQNLALLNHYFWMRCGWTDRHRFLNAYLKARKSRPADPREFGRGVEAETRAWAEKLWRRWGARCRGDNKYFATYQREGAWSVASRDLDEAEFAALLKDPDEPFRNGEAEFLRNS